MAVFNVPPFNIKVGQNVIGPAPVQMDISALSFNLDFSPLVGLQMNPAMLVSLETSLDNGATWQQQVFFDIISLGVNRDGTDNTRFTLDVEADIPARALIRALVDSPVAFHSGGGTILAE